MPAPTRLTRRTSPRRLQSPEPISSNTTDLSSIEGSLMPPPRLTRRRSPSRIQSPEQISSNTIDLPSNKSSEFKSTTEGSFMPPTRLTRRRSPRRLQSPEQFSSNTIDLPSNKLRKELPAQELRRPGDGLSKTRQSAHARSPVAETVSKPSTSAAPNKRRSGVVREVEKMQVTVIQLYIRFVLLVQPRTS